MTDQPEEKELHLEVLQERMPLFTTILQSGIEVKTKNNIATGHFLCNLEGFDSDYLAQAVETIFLNGMPVDSFDTPLCGDNPVLALSAAMPGLAGAIFRKNSFHSALRTDTGKKTASSRTDDTILVTLKLFNTIAKQRGETLLQRGVLIKGHKILKFFENRRTFFNYICKLSFQHQEFTPDSLLQVVPGGETIKLFITRNND
ncbi:hypothetical protein [Desulforhopalus singaporensis]|uniref:Uncharacterized protein n=1 Tax=Desulforhopalus singaporensis TaxID=91360 RepID=A0A1H0U6L4_9BACT|nr:hypothetical protein [Desulforhopalus singaporensis]SDP61801.1 hypothetical protein SAMN05660330_03407 [Desulforhopalus singaporensis]